MVAAGVGFNAAKCGSKRQRSVSAASSRDAYNFRLKLPEPNLSPLRHESPFQCCNVVSCQQGKCFIKSMTWLKANLVAMFEFKREVRIKPRLWLYLLLLVLPLSWGQNASRVVWEPSQATTNNKRDVNSGSSGNGLDYAGTNIAKSYDPPPEFYRGPGSTTGSSASSSTGGFVGSTSGGAQLGTVGENLSEAYNKWRQSAVFQDRISVGMYLKER